MTFLKMVKDKCVAVVGNSQSFFNKNYANFKYLYDIFAENPERHMEECNNERWWGDQGFIEKYIKTDPVYWQDIVPNEIISWKVHCKFGIPKEASIIAFHDNPKSWHVEIPK